MNKLISRQHPKAAKDNTRLESILPVQNQMNIERKFHSRGKQIDSIGHSQAPAWSTIHMTAMIALWTNHTWQVDQLVDQIRLWQSERAIRSPKRIVVLFHFHQIFLVEARPPGLCIEGIHWMQIDFSLQVNVHIDGLHGDDFRGVPE